MLLSLTPKLTPAGHNKCSNRSLRTLTRVTVRAHSYGHRDTPSCKRRMRTDPGLTVLRKCPVQLQPTDIHDFPNYASKVAV